jgi:hypothetical protein
MGQDNGTYMASLEAGNPTLEQLGYAPSGGSFTVAGLPEGGAASTVSVPSDIGSDLYSPTPAPAASVPTVIYQPSTNPSLDAYNQALTNAAASNPSLLNPQTLASLSQAAAVATPQQLQTAAQTLATPSFTQQISTWLSSSTLIAGVANSTVALGSGAVVVLLAALSSRKKGRK